MKILGIIVLVGIIVVGFFVFNKKEAIAPEDEQSTDIVTETNNTNAEDETVVSNTNNDTTTNVEPKAPKEDVGAVFSPLKTVALEASNFSFFTEEIRVKKGDTVKIILANKEGFHDVVIDEFNVATKKISAGQTDSIEFVADKVGTFEYYCSVGSHRAQGMVGKLIVE